MLPLLLQVCGLLLAQRAGLCVVCVTQAGLARSRHLAALVP